MFILNPDPYSLPCYHIGPFMTNDVTLNTNLHENNDIEYYLAERFKGKEFSYTYNGREAIHTALSCFNLHKDNVVTILTTSDNFYISGCVTHEIEKFCRWSRKIESETKVIFINHEFGYPYNELLKIKKLGFPIIEDCAHSFFSQDENNTTGTVGDFVIYSFPKMFPLQIGGLLVSNGESEIPELKLLSKGEKRYIINVLSKYINFKNEIIDKRLTNYKYLASKFSEIGLMERFQLNDGIVPGVFMFRKGKHRIDLPELKKHFYAHGIQSSVFYGEESFFIPVHQALNETDLDYFLEVIKSFIKTSSK